LDPDQAIDLARHAIVLTAAVAAPVLLTGLVIAVIVGLLQAATQVQEQTLSFVPKMAAMLIAGLIVAPWMLAKIVEFGKEMFSSLP